MIRVRYGTPEALARGRGQLIRQSRKSGWLYDAERNSVRIGGDVVYKHGENSRFVVEMMPLNLQ